MVINSETIQGPLALTALIEFLFLGYDIRGFQFFLPLPALIALV